LKTCQRLIRDFPVCRPASPGDSIVFPLFIIFAHRAGSGKITPVKMTDSQRWYNSSGQMTAWLKYFITARHRKGHGVHSPFVVDFITSVLRDKTWYNAYGIAEKYRKSVLGNKTLIAVTDFGAGSRVDYTRKRSVADIARHAAVNRKSGRLLYRIAQHYKPELIIELGTSLGISTHYLAFGNPDAVVITIEADPALAAIASENLHKHQGSNVHLVNDTFDNALPSLFPDSPGKTLVFIDGNHSRSATLKYTDFFLSRLPDGSLIVLDDINWSEGMRKAWKEFRENNKYALTVDLFRMGIVFIKHDFFKENYTIRF
jgi:predicted O-methyltransferase YrrM